MTWQDRIVSDPRICHGRPCIKGTRVMVSVLVENLADGQPVPEILKSYPSITIEDLRAALQYAAELARGSR